VFDISIGGGLGALSRRG